MNGATRLAKVGPSDCKDSADFRWKDGMFQVGLSGDEGLIVELKVSPSKRFEREFATEMMETMGYIEF